MMYWKGWFVPNKPTGGWTLMNWSVPLLWIWRIRDKAEVCLCNQQYLAVGLAKNLALVEWPLSCSSHWIHDSHAGQELIFTCNEGANISLDSQAITKAGHKAESNPCKIPAKSQSSLWSSSSGMRGLSISMPSSIFKHILHDLQSI